VSQEWFGATGTLSRCLDNANVGAIGIQAVLDQGDGWFTWRDEWDLREFIADDPVSGRRYLNSTFGNLSHHYTTSSPEFARLAVSHGGESPRFDTSYLFGCHPQLGVRFSGQPRDALEVIAWNFTPTNPGAMRATFVPFDRTFDDFFFSATSIGITSPQTRVYFSAHRFDSNQRDVGWGSVRDCQLRAGTHTH
jgi:hypothetical protein